MLEILSNIVWSSILFFMTGLLFIKMDIASNFSALVCVVSFAVGFLSVLAMIWV